MITTPVLLHDGLNVKDIRYENNSSVQFSQEIVPFPDNKEFKVNYISVYLHRPLKENEEIKIYMDYEGKLYGYSNVMRYMKDSIDMRNMK